jgi:hypothetical protein
VLAGCSRPPCCCDFSFQYNAQRHLSLHRGPRRAAADAGRWAGGFLGLLLHFACAARTSTGNAREPPCRSHKRVHHLLSSTHRRSPATLRLFLTTSPYASPLCHVALRHWLHGAARLILAVLARAFALPKAVRLMCADRQAATPAAPPNTCCSRPPSRCVFPSSCCANRPWRSTLPYPPGGRLSTTVGRHLQAISIFITGCLVLSRLGAPPQNYRRSRRAYSPAPATKTRLSRRSRSAGERAGAPARSCPSGDAVPLRATFSAHSARLARAFRAAGAYRR